MKNIQKIGMFIFLITVNINAQQILGPRMLTIQNVEIIPAIPPSNLRQGSSTQTSYYVQWNEAIHQSGVDYYLLYKDGSPINVGNTLNYLAGGMGVCEKHTWSVKARLNDGSYSDTSSAVQMRTDGWGASGYISSITSTSISVIVNYDSGITSATMKWVQPGQQWSSSSGIGTSFTISGLAPNAYHIISITAVSPCGSYNFTVSAWTNP